MPDREVIEGMEQFRADFKPFCGNHADWKRFDAGLALLKEQAKQIDDLKAELAKTEDNFSEYVEMMKEKQEPMKPDCEHAEHDGIGCLGYCGCKQDDEPIEYCKLCEKYTSNITGEW